MLACVVMACKGPWSASQQSDCNGCSGRSGDSGAGCCKEASQQASQQALRQMLTLQAAGVPRLLQQVAACLRQVAHVLASAHSMVRLHAAGELLPVDAAARDCLKAMFQLAGAAVASAGASALPGCGSGACASAVDGGAATGGTGNTDVEGGHCCAGWLAGDAGTPGAQAVAAAAAAACAGWCEQVLTCGLLQVATHPQRDVQAVPLGMDGMHRAWDAMTAALAAGALPRDVKPLAQALPVDQVHRLKPAVPVLLEAVQALGACTRAICGAGTAAECSPGLRTATGMEVAAGQGGRHGAQAPPRAATTTTFKQGIMQLCAPVEDACSAVSETAHDVVTTEEHLQEVEAEVRAIRTHKQQELLATLMSSQQSLLLQAPGSASSRMHHLPAMQQHAQQHRAAMEKLDLEIQRMPTVQQGCLAVAFTAESMLCTMSTVAESARSLQAQAAAAARALDFHASAACCATSPGVSSQGGACAQKVGWEGAHCRDAAGVTPAWTWLRQLHAMGQDWGLLTTHHPMLR